MFCIFDKAGLRYLISLNVVDNSGKSVAEIFNHHQLPLQNKLAKTIYNI